VKSIPWGLNTTLNKTTGKTPYELLLGYQPRQANDSFLSAEMCDTQYDDHLSVTREHTSERIREKQAEHKARYDLRRRPTPTYNVGQQVLVRRVIPTNNGNSKKLLQKYSVPYVIKKILDCDRFIISDLQGTTRSQRPYEGVVSLNKMKPYNMAPGTDVNSSSGSDGEDDHEANSCTRNISTHNISTRNICTRNISTRNVCTRNIYTRNICTRNIYTRNG
jgi:hypothetical protein